jgi:hypothetical protein
MIPFIQRTWSAPRPASAGLWCFNASIAIRSRSTSTGTAAI